MAPILKVDIGGIVIIFALLRPKIIRISLHPFVGGVFQPVGITILKKSTIYNLKEGKKITLFEELWELYGVLFL
jgi:hypothetical protein